MTISNLLSAIYIPTSDLVLIVYFFLSGFLRVFLGHRNTRSRLQGLIHSLSYITHDFTTHVQRLLTASLTCSYGVWHAGKRERHSLQCPCPSLATTLHNLLDGRTIETALSN